MKKNRMVKTVRFFCFGSIFEEISFFEKDT